MSTQVSADRSAAGSTPTPRFVLGVDDAERSSGALLWTCAESARSHLPVELVSACPVHLTRAPMRHLGHAVRELETSVTQSLARLVQRLPGDAETLPSRVAPGAPRSVLLDALDDEAALLVVGSRRGHVERMLLGSTSAAVAGRAPVPVVVVPDGWTADRDPGPLVVGTALGEESEDHLLRFAFDRARDVGAAVVVVHAWEAPALQTWSPSDVRDYRSRVLAALDELLEPWGRTYPDIEVATSAVAAQPADAVLDTGRVAQMVIVGRHAPASRYSGVRLGSTARSVLHRAGVPVAVIPPGSASPSKASAPDAEGRASGAPTWAPTF
jgi:nucleotide-binding universal stress UspA family protein